MSSSDELEEEADQIPILAKRPQLLTASRFCHSQRDNQDPFEGEKYNALEVQFLPKSNSVDPLFCWFSSCFSEDYLSGRMLDEIVTCALDHDYKMVEGLREVVVEVPLGV